MSQNMLLGRTAEASATERAGASAAFRASITHRDATGAVVRPQLTLAASPAARPVDPVRHLAELLREPEVVARLQAGRRPVRGFDAQYWACWALTLAAVLTAFFLLFLR